MNAQKRDSDIVYWLGNKLYLNITNRCSNCCSFCFRKFKSGIKEFNLNLEKEPTPEELMKELERVKNRNNWSEIVFCGFGEPLERLDLVLEVSKWLKKNWFKPLRVNTNGHGYLLNKGRNVVRELKEAGIEKISVSLNTHNKEIYNQICKPIFPEAFENVVEFLKNAKDEEIETEATAVTIPEVKITKVKELADRIGVKFRVRQHVPFLW